MLEAIKKQKPPCGTVVCIAGQALITLAKLRPRSKVLYGRGPNYYEFSGAPDVRARRLLKLTERQADDLFFPCYWPARFEDALEDANPGTKKYLKIVKKRWQHMIDTGE
jgi:hypothetical protein